jgi:deoxyribonuclease V
LGNGEAPEGANGFLWGMHPLPLVGQQAALCSAWNVVPEHVWDIGRPFDEMPPDDSLCCAPYLHMQVSLQHEHDWKVSPDEAKRIQRRLESEVTETSLPEDVETVAGIDVSIRDDTAQAAVAVLALPDLEVVDEAIHRCEVPFPYVPGLLSFRETPPVLPALEQLSVPPDVLMTDSHGRAHPRRFGFACHLGVLLDRPTLGVAKSILVGTPWGDLETEKGSRTPLVDEGKTVGSVLRTRTDVNPVYVSVGHRLTLDDAVSLTLDCSPRYKIPEPTRQAHRLSRAET